MEKVYSPGGFMKIVRYHFVFVFLFYACLFHVAQVSAAYVLKDGKLIDADQVATLPADEHFALGSEAYRCHDWDEAVRQFYIVTRSFSGTVYAKEAFFYLGESYYRIGEFEFANQEFTHYIKSQNNPRLFEEAIQFKYAIAEAFKEGARRRILGSKHMPKWLSAHKMALETYDEVIATVPCHELAAQALFSKGDLLWNMQEYRASIEAYQMLIRRFPKHELAPESYLVINRIYLDQSVKEFQNPDLLALAQLNLKKFKQDFPGEERLVDAENDVLEIKEVYARGLYETGQFYERLNKPNASLIYYQNAIKQFPDTSIAQECRERLSAISSSEG